jgi:hypothetical protein
VQVLQHEKHDVGCLLNLFWFHPDLPPFHFTVSDSVQVFPIDYTEVMRNGMALLKHEIEPLKHGRPTEQLSPIAMVWHDGLCAGYGLHPAADTAHSGVNLRIEDAMKAHKTLEINLQHRLKNRDQVFQCVLNILCGGAFPEQISAAWHISQHRSNDIDFAENMR